MTDDLPELTDLQRLQVDVDQRLSAVWLVVMQPGSVLAEVFGNERYAQAMASALRAAYGWGYDHARREVRAGLPAVLGQTEGEA